MENNLNENLELSKEQIRFIDYGFIGKQKNLKDVIEELVKQDDNNFQKKDVAQIIELYREIKRQKPKRNKNKWPQEQDKQLEAEIKKKGKSIEITDLAKELEETGLFKPHSKKAIINKIYRLTKQSKSNQEEDKITENVDAENYDYINISSQNNDKTNKDFSKTFGEKLNKCLNDTEQLNNTEDRLTKINTSENDKSNNSNTSVHNSLSNIMSDLSFNKPSSNEHLI